MHILTSLIVFMIASVHSLTLDTETRHNVAVFIPNSAIETPEQIATKHGFVYGGKIGELGGYHIFHRDITNQGHEHGLRGNPQVEWYEDQFPKQRYTRKAHININALKKSVTDYRASPDRQRATNFTKARQEHAKKVPTEKSDTESRTLINIGDDNAFEEYAQRVSVVEEPERGWQVPLDPKLTRQWHLVNPNNLPGNSHLFIGRPINLDVLGAWQQGVTGDGIVVAIVDDGLEVTHPDVRPNYKEAGSWDVNADDGNPSPERGDSHGTAAGGLVAAASNSVCGVGVAYNAGLSGIRILGRPSTDAEEAFALGYRCAPPPGTHGQGLVNDVYSNSWGPIDSGAHLDGPGRLTACAIKECAESGRQGLGNVYVWAGGNGRYLLDNSNYDGYANSRYTIAVAAIDDYGDVTWYSEPGANIIVCAPSSGGSSSRRITTIDLSGRFGTTQDDCRDDFGGTSAAAPQVAGVVALVLQVQRTLSWRDVQHILIRSASKAYIRPSTRSADTWVTNAAGLTHSDDFGFGVVNATAAVNLARTWIPLKNSILVSTDEISENGFEVGPGVLAEFHWEAPPTLQRMSLEHVELSIAAHTPNGHGWMAIQLCSPTGTCSILQNSNPGRQRSVSWTYMTVKHWGEDIVDRRHAAVRNADPAFKSFNTARAVGDAVVVPPNMWYMRVANLCNVRSDPITMRSWKIDFWGFTTGGVV